MMLRTLLPLVLVGLSSCATLNHGGEQGESASLGGESRAAPGDAQTCRAGSGWRRVAQRQLKKPNE